jgi:hypothetical protein
VGARFFRERRQRTIEWASFTPERYTEVAHLQFESVSRTTYYPFYDDNPLTVRVSGPTLLECRTRLDFKHASSGSQPYALEVLLDGEPWQTFHFDTRKLEGGVWLERADIMPGQRRTITLEIPAGSHRIEVRCLRPQGSSVAAMIRIPAHDIR